MIDRRLKLRHLQAFVEITRRKSLKRAAEVLLLTQPAISRSLAELEEITGAPLLTRGRSGTSLTAQGEAFLHAAEASLAALRQGLDSAARVGAGRLRVGALPSVAARLMPQVALDFAQQAPDTVLQIADGAHGVLTEQLRAGSLDVVIGRMGEPEAMQGVSFTLLYSELVAFVTRPGHPILAAPDLARLGDWLVIYPSPGSAIRPAVDRFFLAQGQPIPPRRIETVSGAFGRVLTPNSDAIWIISSGVVANELRDGRLVQLPFDTALTTGPVGLMTRAEGDPAPAQALFARLVLKHTRAMDQGAQR